MVESGNPMLEYEAFQRVGKLLFSLPSPDDDSVELIVSMLGNVALANIFAYGDNGQNQTLKGFRVTDEMWDAIVELRRTHYREGSGTWFSAKIVIDLDGSTASYNYDEEPIFGDTPIDSSEYAIDQELYPRIESKQPDWLKNKLAGK